MQVLNVFHVLIAIAMVIFILVQRGAGATAGAAFGSGASGTVFGARGAGSFLSRATWTLGAAFCLISLSMAVVVSRDLARGPDLDLGVVGGQPATEQAAPAPVGDLPTIDPNMDMEAAGEAAASTVAESATETDVPAAGAGQVPEMDSDLPAEAPVGEEAPPVEGGDSER